MTWLIRRVYGDDWAEEKDTSVLDFETPALGDGFAFHIVVRCVHEAGSRRQGRGIREAVEEERAKAHDVARKVVRQVCRCHSPFEPGPAEMELNERIDAAFAEHSTLRGRWTVHAEVGLTDAVRQHQRETLLEQQKLASHGETVKLRLKEMQALTAAGEQFLSSAGEQWITRYAVRLAQQPEAAADIVVQMLDERHKLAEQFVKLVNDVSAAHKQADLYDLAIASEGALRHALKQLGVDVPPLESDSLFPPRELRF
ncbi:hypothetical protein Misp01_29890 [Microtetraspora sp. NBRC 13810]|uniref:hypothetical protein n=1 Tax=Microtetraspora sp. NBRC 13810 TaxID=3030990 RepID=UPI0024A2CA44|nr:hypothetical protein [Microtetraspora sp. NBRC 13810]GLW07859.1 hypothetical protein Misp01_29890 [Microtetraspora sp. NBRC 13810]